MTARLQNGQYTVVVFSDENYSSFGMTCLEDLHVYISKANQMKTATSMWIGMNSDTTPIRDWVPIWEEELLE